jgi:glutamate--cysteine ligase
MTFPSQPGRLTEERAQAYLSGICFKTGPPGGYGVELEWLLYDQTDPLRRIAAAPVLCELVRPARGRLTVEPGGQLEYSSHVGGDLASCVADTVADMARLRTAAGRAGLRLVGLGIDPYRGPRRILDLPRYAAMERFFDADGCAGRWMMTNTASVQVCLDAGEQADGCAGFRRRWQVAHAIGPVFVAAFANSAVARGRRTGWASTRQEIWSRTDPSRTWPVAPGNPLTQEIDPVDAWIRYVLDARLMLIRRQGGRPWTAPRGMTFRSWIRRGGSRPTIADLDDHVTTLFPPVRPRGYLEFRMIDAQRDDGWVVPLAVCATLLDDPVAAQAALAAVEPLWHGVGGVGGVDGAAGGAAAGADGAAGGLWRRAARFGLADPGLAAAARTCFQAVIAALPAGQVRSATEAFAERYVERGRCPADDSLEGAERGQGSMMAG